MNAGIYIREIKGNISERALLEQLAEEASELSQAALKLIRAAGMSDNPTPVGAEQAAAQMLEETVDVLNCLTLLGYDLDELVACSERSKKFERMAIRLRRL